MNPQLKIQTNHSQQSISYKINERDLENSSYRDIIEISGENNNNRISSNARLFTQPKDETNIESSHTLMQKPNTQQEEIKLSSKQKAYFNQNNLQQQQFIEQPNNLQMNSQYNYLNSIAQLNAQQQLQFNQYNVQSNQTLNRQIIQNIIGDNMQFGTDINQNNTYYKSRLQQTQHRMNENQENQENINLNFTYTSMQQFLSKSQHMISELKLKPVQYELYKNLKEMKVKSEIAFFILVSENCMSMEEALSFITTDEQNMHQHIFLPRSNQIGDVCEICMKTKRFHLKNQEDIIQKGLAIRENIRQLVQQDCLENADMKEMILQASQSSNISFNQRNQLDTVPSQNSPKTLRNRTQMCQICLSQVDESSMLFFNGQNHLICIECFRTFLTEEIMISHVENLKCPHCAQQLTEQIIFDHTNAAMYKKYKHFLSNALINRDPLKRFCPTPNCNHVIELQNKSQKLATCQSCKVVICSQCNRIEHQGISCDELMEKEIEGLTDSRDIQRCIKCKSLVQKASGCNHMTCSICEYQWCWLCGNTYTYIHMMPLNPFGCPFLQNGRFTVKNMQMWKIYILRFFTLIIVLILLPFAILFSGPILALYGYSVVLQRILGINVSQVSLLQRALFIFIGFIIFVLGFLLDILIIIAIIPFGVYVFYIQCREKNRIEALSNQRLRELQNRNNEIQLA